MLRVKKKNGKQILMRNSIESTVKSAKMGMAIKTSLICVTRSMILSELNFKQ